MGEVWKYKPDILVIAYGRNDELDIALAPTKESRNKEDIELMPFEKNGKERNSEAGEVNPLTAIPVYRFIQTRIANYWALKNQAGIVAGSKMDRRRRRVPLDQFRANLTAMIEEGKRRDVTVILPAIGMYLKLYRDVMIEVGKNHKIAAYDMFDIFFKRVKDIKIKEEFTHCRAYLERALGKDIMSSSPGGWLYFSTDFGHPNSCGHKVIANTIIEDISKVVIRLENN